MGPFPEDLFERAAGFPLLEEVAIVFFSWSYLGRVVHRKTPHENLFFVQRSTMQSRQHSSPTLLDRVVLNDSSALPNYFLLVAIALLAPSRGSKKNIHQLLRHSSRTTSIRIKVRNKAT
jgi:hypothetical protein